MNWTRRELLKVGTGSAALHALWLAGITGCKSGKPLPKLLPEQPGIAREIPGRASRLPVLRPSSTEGDEDRCALKAIEANAKIIPGLDTPIWGFHGTFPGPTIEARRGRRVALAIENELTVPIVNHLHGGRTPPSSDGYPTDLILPTQGWPSGHVHDRPASIATGTRDYLYLNDQRAATL
jgi:FtsP/CotA-like multicopper oxidase with cupredoxin domain